MRSSIAREASTSHTIRMPRPSSSRLSVALALGAPNVAARGLPSAWSACLDISYSNMDVMKVSVLGSLTMSRTKNGQAKSTARNVTIHARCARGPARTNANLAVKTETVVKHIIENLPLEGASVLSTWQRSMEYAT